MSRCSSNKPVLVGAIVRMAVALSAVFALTGCSGGAAEVSMGARPLSRMSIGYYGDAHAAFCRSMTLQAGPDVRAAQLDECMKRLRAAMSTSSDDAGNRDAYACPLFRTTIGEVLMEGDESAKREAFDLFERSVSDEGGVPEWIPGWLGQAAWATDAISKSADNAARAEAYLDEAEESLKRLIAAGQKRPEPGPFRGILSFTQPSPDDEPPPDDAALSADRRRQMLWNWLLAGEQWWDPTWSSSAVPNEPPPAAKSIDALERRMRARIALQRSRIRLAQGQPPSVVRSTLRNYRVDDKLNGALDWDPDYWPAQLLEARMYRLGGDARAAVPTVNSLVSLQGSILAGNARLALELGLLYVDWYAHDKGGAALDAASHQLKLVTGTLDPYSAEAWLAIARLQALAVMYENDWSLSNRQTILGDARGAAEIAERNGAAPRALDDVRTLIATAGASLSAE